MAKEKKTVKKLKGERVLKRFRTANKEITPEIEEQAADLDTYAALDALAVSEGGQILVDNLSGDIVNIIEWLSVKGLSDPEAILRGRCADLKSKIEMLRSITRARNNKEVLEETIAEALKE